MNHPGPGKRLCVVTTSDLIVRFFLRDWLRALSARYRVTLVVNTADRELTHGIDVELRPMPIARDIAPFADLGALARLALLFARGRYDGVISIAPKAGLLAAVAARLARVPFRCHVFQGEVWATRKGAMRSLLKALDRVVVASCTHLLVISRSEHAFLEREKVLASGRAELISEGSLSGVNLDRFRADPRARAEVRAELGIPADAAVALFMGRLRRDKGVLDLARAFRIVADQVPDAWLLVVGPDEDGVREIAEREAGPSSGRIRWVGLTDRPERYHAAADAIALPSYREGFGNVILEAAAAGVPAVASRIYGIEDALAEGETGLMHAPGDVQELATRLTELLRDPARRAEMGRKALERVRRDFSSDAVNAFWLAYLERSLEAS